MQLYTQIGLAAIPILGAILIGSSLIQPAMEEAGLKSTELESVKQEYDILEIKLTQKHKLLAKRKQIHSEIAQLRTYVPDKPDLDLLIIDLEKICSTNQVSLLGIEEYEESKANQKKENLMASLVNEVGGKMPLAKPQILSRAKKKNNQVSAKNKTEEKDPLGLKHITRRIYISGDYSGLTGVLRNLESYQRIVGIRDLTIALPEEQGKETQKTLASKRGKELGLKKPVMTFLLHIYFLPS